MSSISGFLKSELYRELEVHLMSHLITKDTISICCSMFTELALTNNEAQNLVSFSVDMLSVHVFTKNTWVIDQFTKCCEQVLNSQTFNIHKKVHNHALQKSISNIVMILLIYGGRTRGSLINVLNDDKMEDEKNDNIYFQVCHLSIVSKKVESNQAKFALFREYAAEYEYDDRIFLKFSHYFPNVDGCISDCLFRKVCALLCCIQFGKKEMNLIHVLIYDLFHEGSKEGLKINKISQFHFPDLCHVRTQAKSGDIIWLIWLGILNLAKKHFKDNHPLIKNLFLLSQIGFHKKNRIKRVNLMLFVLLFFMPGRCVYEERKEDVSCFEKVSSKISIFFEDIYHEKFNNIKKPTRINHDGVKDVIEDVVEVMEDGDKDNKNNNIEPTADISENYSKCNDVRRPPQYKEKTRARNFGKGSKPNGKTESETSSEGIPDYMNIVPTKM